MSTLKIDRRELRRNIVEKLYGPNKKRPRWDTCRRTITPNNSRRFRKYKCSYIGLTHFDNFINMSNVGNEKEISQNQRYNAIMNERVKNFVLNHVKTTVLNAPIHGDEKVISWLSTLPGVNCGEVYARALTTIPLGIDLEHPGNFDQYTSETVDLSELWRELRIYDYLIFASQRFLKDLWLATKDEAHASLNKKLNIFNYFGYHNLLANRALKLYELFRRNPPQMVRRFVAKTAIVSHRRLKPMCEINFVGKFSHDEIIKNFSTYLQELISPNFDPTAYMDKEDFKEDFGFTCDVYEQLETFLNYLQTMYLTSVLCDYSTPIFITASQLQHMAIDSAKDRSLQFTRMKTQAEDDPDEMYQTEYTDGSLPYLNNVLFRGLTHPKCGLKLDFEKGIRKSSLLASDDIMEDYYNSANYVEDIGLEVTDNHYGYAWITTPVYVCDQYLVDHKQMLDTTKTSCIAETAEFDVVYQMTNESETPTLPKFITFGSNAMYPDEFCNQTVSGPSLGKGVITYQENILGDQSWCSTYLLISSIIDQNDNPRFTLNDLGVKKRAAVNAKHAIPTGLGANCSVLQYMSIFYTKYVEWVENVFDVSTLPEQQKKLLARAKKLAKLLAKHGSPERALGIVENIVKQCKPLPTNDL